MVNSDVSCLDMMLDTTRIFGMGFKLFQTNFAKNPQDKAAWEKYRCGILEYGGSRDELHRLEDFLGYRPSAALFLSLNPTPGHDTVTQNNFK